jgi:hypothetical protein
MPFISFSDELKKQMATIKKEIVANSAYLGDLSIHDKLVWDRQGCCDVLVLKSDALTVKQALQEHSIALEGDPEQPSPSLYLPAETKPACLSAVIHISEDEYWLTSCGNWHGPNVAAQTLVDIKPTCVGGSPAMEPFATNFSNIISNAEWLLDQATTQGFTRKCGLLHHVN